MKLIVAAAAILGICASALLTAPAQAAICGQFAKLIEYNYNSDPSGFNSNMLNWTAKPGSPSGQIWKVERSDDSGNSWQVVQQSTARNWSTQDHLGDNVLLRLSPTSCSGGAQVIQSDPVSGPSLRTTYF